MQRTLIAVIVAAVAIFVVKYLREGSRDTPPVPTAVTVSAKPAAPLTAAPAPPAHATRITPDARRQIAERIAAAQAARAARAAKGSPPAGTAPPSSTQGNGSSADQLVETMKTPILNALKETIPFLQECFAQLPEPRPRFQFKGNLTLTGDVDIGTLVDADKLTDDRDQPLPAALDDCLRGTLQTIQLAPLREGDKLMVTYVFSDDEN